ncbi:hypothetical protein N665_0024s0012 [Sinapis alba]|nr:hypothetical protein N665_0024s0012 [Sinapis alba]
MEEDTQAILQKQNASKQAQAKPADTKQEPRQHTSFDKGDRKKGFVYVVDEDDIPASAVVMREKGCNTWEREPEPKPDASPKPSSTVDLNKYCETTRQGQGIATNKREKEDEPADTSAKEDQSHNRWCNKVILAQREISSDKETAPVFDLRKQLTRQHANNSCQIASDLRRHLDKPKKSRNSKQSATQEYVDKPGDLRTKIESRRAQRQPQINIIMGRSPYCGDSFRAVKDYRRQAATSQKWPTRSENDPQIVFSADDTISVHSPHNDPLLVELRIRRCDVTKALIDTCSSVDLIFRDTLEKMGIDLRDMKPST